MVSKRQDEQDATAQFIDADIKPKPKKRRFGKSQDDLKDLVPINKATPILPSTTVQLSKTGVLQKSYSDQSKSEGQSIYQCLLMKPGTEILCTYYMAQMVERCTHILCKHMQICIKCRLCAKKCYSSTQMSLHLKMIHRVQKAEWFKLTPLLEGDVKKVTVEVLAANLQEMETIKDEPEEDE